MIVTNSMTDPNCLKQYQAVNATAAKASDGRWSYTAPANAAQYTSAIAGVFPNSLAVGTIVGLLVNVNVSRIGIQNTTRVDTYGTNAATFRITAAGDHAIWLNAGDTVALHQAVIYTPESYAIVKTLGLPYWAYFDGGTMLLA